MSRSAFERAIHYTIISRFKDKNKLEHFEDVIGCKITDKLTVSKFANLDNTVRPVFTRRGLYYYDPKWLEPFEGDYDSLFIRCDNNFDSQPYIAVKSGIFIVGFIILRNLNLQLKMFANKSNEDLRTLCSMLEVIE